MNSWVAHRNTAVFGPDADVFRPERWLEGDKERAKMMEQNFMPFGLGSRVCIGRNISLLEMNKVIPVIVQRFDFEFCPEIREDWSVKNRWFVKPVNFRAAVIKRN